MAQGLFAELEAGFDPRVVRLAPRRHVFVEIDRAHEVPPVDFHAFVEPVEDVGVRQAVAPIVLERFDQKLLIVIVLRKSACDAGNPHEGSLNRIKANTQGIVTWPRLQWRCSKCVRMRVSTSFAESCQMPEKTTGPQAHCRVSGRHSSVWPDSIHRPPLSMIPMPSSLRSFHSGPESPL